MITFYGLTLDDLLGLSLDDLLAMEMGTGPKEVPWTLDFVTVTPGACSVSLDIQPT